jgi:hypothetical protein
MRLDAQMLQCPKCDNRLDEQHDGSIITVDIAHHGETVRQALAKLDEEIAELSQGTAQSLRAIVGSGLIREEVLLTLSSMQRHREIKKFGIESHNPGAILIQIK